MPTTNSSNMKHFIYPAKDLGAGEFHTSTKFDGYAWVASTERVVDVPNDQADDVDMEEDDDDGDDDDDEDVQEEKEFLPSLQVIVRPQEKTGKEEDVR